MAAGERLDAMDVDPVEVYTLPQVRSVINPAISVPMLDLYTRKRIVYRDSAIPRPTGETIATSPLRFTWEYDTPSYYAPGPEPSGGAVAVISSHSGQALPEKLGGKITDLRPAGAFETPDKLFKFKSFIYLYAPPR